MKLSVTAWSFPALTMKEVGGLAEVLSIPAVDIGLFYASALDKARVVSDPEAYGREVREALPVEVANYYHLFGDGLAGRNLALPSDPENMKDCKAALSFAKAAGAPTVFVLPGMVNPGQSRKQALDQSVENLKPMVAAGQEIGVTLTVEPHTHGLLESVEMTHEMVNRVPGLKLALDPAHYLTLGYRQDEIETLCPHTGHVHLRQGRPGVLQAKMDEGTLNFPAFFGALRDAGYDGWLAIEYVHQAYMNTVFDDVLTETVRMRDTFNAWNA
ncbi:sugar phosphate isomerase/epimerase family protein [Roseisalinus antarcticus]|uniref:Xylose isomerase-like TIM barrel n=1 Tax=Roseisalinus antarcticus TaxID=254357 RepID=A0A1Y5THL7_9RHOB|nr:sugar phosphate isomerase/epimerase family protein [Roseisalinus antarcticus]SLN64489.1 Xylose isomerase-like TIM barrel [Roseisalinus antarcticus]